MTEIEALRAEVAELREEVRRLREASVVHHYHHQVAQPSILPPSPYEPPPWQPYWPVTCGGGAESIWPTLCHAPPGA